MKIRGIAFDMEGTVVDVEWAHHNAFFQVCAEIGHPMTFSEALDRIPRFIGGGDNIISACLHELPGVTQTAEELLARKKEIYEDLIRRADVSPRPGFLDFLAEVRRLGLQVSIGSLTSKVQAAVLLERSGIGALVGEANIILREHVQNCKPARDVFIETARRMGIDPKDQLVFEDSPSGARAAIAAGSRVIGMPVYTTPKAQHDLIDAGVCRIFWDWHEINVEALLYNLNKTDCVANRKFGQSPD